jgi:phage tail-like protein
MTQFAVNAGRFDPYKDFKFRVKWDGRHVPGVSYVSPLRRITEVVTHRDGGELSTSRRSPGRTMFEPIALARGVTHDTAFEDWARKVSNPLGGIGAEVSLADFRKDIAIELYNEAGQLVKAYRVFRCWPSEYQALPELDANGNDVALEVLVLQHEGWERDRDVAEPTEPTYD